MLRYVFLGSPGIAATILEKIVEQVYPPLLVVTQTAKPAGRGKAVSETAVSLTAKKLNIPVIEAANINTPEILDQLAKLQPDLLLVAAFGQIFKEPILQLPKLACLNVHASLLPKYRGAAPVQRAIWAGDKVTGITIQKMVKKLDAGDILVQKTVAIDASDTSETLLSKLALSGAEGSIEAIRLLESGKFQFVPQDESKVSLAPKIEKEDAEIDWKKGADFISNQVRALQPWPVACTSLGGERVRVFKAEVDPQGQSNKPAGTVETDSKTYLKVVAGDRRLVVLTEIQAENRKRLEIKEFLKGFRGLFPHTTMGRQ